MSAWIFLAGVVAYAVVTFVLDRAARVVWSCVRG